MGSGHRGRQGEWPKLNPETGSDARANGRWNGHGHFLQMDMVSMEGRPVAGPLRYGTAFHDNVGPRGKSIEAADSMMSDMGMDRISPRGFDPGGWPVWDRQAPSGLVATHVREGTRQGSRDFDRKMEANMMAAGRNSHKRRP
ncbi:MAG: hypothetical protein J2P53_14985 [Bradyrhizobiaceae bacterium]|nr:hypothetical protein [Bradyrhizobiaceae bacterium]